MVNSHGSDTEKDHLVEVLTDIFCLVNGWIDLKKFLCLDRRNPPLIIFPFSLIRALKDEAFSFRFENTWLKNIPYFWKMLSGGVLFFIRVDQCLPL